MSALSDVARAVSTRWDDAGLNASVPGGLHLDELPKDGTVPLAPWAILRVSQDRSNLWGLGSFTAYTRATVEVYGTGSLGTAASTIHAAYHWPDQTLDFGFAEDVAHLYTELGDDSEEPVPGGLERNGQRLRVATINLIIWTQRLRA